MTVTCHPSPPSPGWPEAVTGDVTRHRRHGFHRVSACWGPPGGRPRGEVTGDVTRHRSHRPAPLPLTSPRERQAPKKAGQKGQGPAIYEGTSFQVWATAGGLFSPGGPPGTKEARRGLRPVFCFDRAAAPLRNSLMQLWNGGWYIPPPGPSWGPLDPGAAPVACVFGAPQKLQPEELSQTALASIWRRRAGS